MKKLLKGCFHILRISIVVFLLMILLAVIGFQVVFKSGGMPEQLKKELISYSSEFGIYFDCEQIELNPITGVELVDLKVYENLDKKKATFTADSVLIKTNLLKIIWGTEKLEALEMKNGTFDFELPQLENTGVQHINLKELNFNAYRQAYSLIINNFNGNSPIADFHFNGQIKDFFTVLGQNRKKKATGSLFEGLRKSLTHAIEPHKPLLTKIHDDIKSDLTINGKGKVDVKLSLDAQTPSNNNIDFQIKLPDLVYQGIWMKSFTTKLKVAHDTFKIHQLNLAIDKDEYLKGEVNYNAKDNTISAQLEGKSYAIRFIRLVVTEESAFTRFIKYIDNKGDAPTFKLRIPPCQLGSQIHGEADIDVADTTFKELYINRLSGTLAFNENSLDFRNCKMEVNSTNSGNFCGTYIFNTGEIYMSAVQTGPPLFVKNFLGPNSSRQYQKLWKDYIWQSNYPPVFNFSFRAMVKEPFEFYLLGDLNASNFFVRGEDVEQFQTDVVLDFTKQATYVQLSGIEYKKGEKQNLYGGLTYTYKKDKENQFVNFDLSGRVDPKKVFRIIGANSLVDSLENLTFSNLSRIDTSGFVDLKNGEKTKFEVTFRAPDLVYKNFHLKKPQGRIFFTDNFMRIYDIDHHIYGGHCSGELNFDFKNDTVKMNYLADNLKLEQIPEAKDRAQGIGAVKIDALMNFSEEITKYEGDLKLDITKGKFWKVPVLTGLANALGKVLPTKGLGEISEIHAEGKLNETILKLSKLNTNGNVIALNGAGDIELHKEEVNILFEVKPLSKVFWDIIPTLLKPLTKTIQLRLQGPYDDMKWTPASGLW